MTTYRVQYLTTASCILSVEAESTEDAREKADEQFDPPYVCAQCAGMGYSSSPGIELSEWEQDDSPEGVWS